VLDFGSEIACERVEQLRSRLRIEKETVRSEVEPIDRSDNLELGGRRRMELVDAVQS